MAELQSASTQAPIVYRRRDSPRLSAMLREPDRPTKRVARSRRRSATRPTRRGGKSARSSSRYVTIHSPCYVGPYCGARGRASR
jgi:hypothetical protein